LQTNIYTMKKIALLILGAVLLFAGISSCEHEVPVNTVDNTPLPGPVPNNGVCFESEILPLFQSNCAKAGCHDAATQEEGLILDSYANIMRKDIVAGDADRSKIYRVLFENGKDKMPPPPNADLTAAQKALIGKWINEGAKNTVNCNVSCDTAQFKYAANVSPVINTFCTGCHSGAAPSGSIDLTNYNNVKIQATNGRLVGAITHAAGYAAMPKDAAKLNDCQISQIKKWIAAGALNN
jgi:Planctomycete cytochrome C